MPEEYVVVDTEFHHIPLEAAKKARDLPDTDLKFKSIVRNPDFVYRKVFDIETCKRHMDECGVDVALAGLGTWTVASLEVCRQINDEMGKLGKDYPERFIPMAHVPYGEGQSAIDELERAVNDLGLKGVTLVSGLRGMRLDDKTLKPFFKKVSQLRVPVMVHPTVKIPIWGGEKYFMSGGVSREYDIIKSFVEVLCGVLPEFPDLTFIFSHYGGGVPFLLGRIMSWYVPGKSGIPEEMRGKPKTIRQFEEYGLKEDFVKLFDRFYFNMAGTGGWMPPFKQALMVIKPERLCFGSDYPWEMGRASDMKAYINAIKQVDIPEEDKMKILGGNMLRLFKVRV
jgi:predicted TIM-barrel fold metal-dependent hydrolase